MVKNPVNPDLMLWAGALERLMMHGISSLYAIHRGFSVPGPGLYRNDPFWNIPMELRRMFPQLPLISDPSHICGHTALLRTVAQKAIDLGFDGLMIEAHIRPEEALTDRGQQLTPPELGILLDGLSPSTGISHLAGIGALRDEIDRLDDVLIEVLAKRMAVADKIGGIKKETGLEIHDPERWKALLADRLEKAARFGLDPALLKTILDEIHHHSKKRQG
jgi:chorismate mutase